MTERMLLEGFLILLLVVANGIFAMSEIAIVSSRKARLERMARAGSRRALAALRLAENPDRFLATVQIGITAIGILAGAFGGATLARQISAALTQYPILAPWSSQIAVALVVVMITYLSLVIGELVPKRIGLAHPERIASLVAPSMNVLARLAAPAVRVLSISTGAVYKILRITPSGEPDVTEEELRLMLREGASAGTIPTGEQQIVERVFRLGDRTARAVMTPRPDLVVLDLKLPLEELRNIVQESGHSRFPLIEGEVDQLVGILRSRDLWFGKPRTSEDLRSRAVAPLFVPRNVAAFDVLEQFRATRNHVAIVLDEYGSVDGMLTPADILEALVGELPESHDEVEPTVFVRSDGVLSVDASFDLEEVKSLIAATALEEEQSEGFHTIAGYVIHRLGRLPRTGDVIMAAGRRFEIVDMDGRRVDRIWIFPPDPQESIEE